MSKTPYKITDFLAGQFDFFKQKSNEYSVLLIGQSISELELKSALKSFKSQRDAKALSHFFEEKNIQSIGLVKKEAVANFSKELALIEQKLNLHEPHFLVLLDYEDPNIHRSPNSLPAEECFLISPNEFAHFCQAKFSTGLAYHLIEKAVARESVLGQIAVHQIGHPKPTLVRDTSGIASAEIIMPHRGNAEDLEDLETALWYLQKQKKPAKKISVCFDEEVTDLHFDLVDKHTETSFFVNLPSGVGPYPSRDVLARATEEKVIMFHDSDDFSTIDRVAVLTDVLKNKKLDVAGSHELRINKIDKKIQAVRFPLDVTEVYKKEERHSIFFPTTAIKKSAYLKAGGLSTIRKHSSDSQFYRRAHFFLNMKNVDEFLYIRSKRANSLTTATATALGTTVRERLVRQWRLDAVRVQDLNIELQNSTLVDEQNIVDIEVISLEKKHRKSILAWQEAQQEIKTRSLSRNLGSVFPNEKDIISDRLGDYRLAKDPGIKLLKASFSWRIGWAITRVIIALFGWIPYVRKRL